MKRLLLGTAAALAIATPAWADSFTYTSFSVNPDLPITLDGAGVSNKQVDFGEINLMGTGTLNGQSITSLEAWCVDILTGLNATGSYNIVPFSMGSVGNGNTPLTAGQVTGMASLIDAFGTSIGGGIDDNPGATQLAIWRLEYPTLTFTSSDTTVDTDIALSATLALDFGQGGIDFNPNAQLALLDVVPTNQVLAIGVPEPVPLPATASLFLGGLGMLGFLAKRRKRQAA